jgi:hypothetical protein
MAFLSLAAPGFKTDQETIFGWEGKETRRQIGSLLHSYWRGACGLASATDQGFDSNVSS